ncbi:MAG: hypothetical protein ACHQE6_02385 [Solirubrobacterales bacterium]
MSLGPGVAPAGATSEIEGVWSFNGGEVAVHAVGGGKLEGVVVTPTTFDECPHQAGEDMWTGMTLQTDGSYWGFHQWLFEKSCVANPMLGPTAWRVLRTAAGSRSLEVCFSEPGKTQPTISPAGSGANDTYGCKTSAPTAPLPVVVQNGPGGGGQSGEQISFAGTIHLPKATGCVRRRSLKLKVHDPARDPLKEIVVWIKKRKVADVRGVKRLKHSIVLKGLPSGTYTLRIVATTVLDQKLSGKRTFHSCTGRRSTGRTRLHPRKHH